MKLRLTGLSQNLDPKPHRGAQHFLESPYISLANSLSHSSQVTLPYFLFPSRTSHTAPTLLRLRKRPAFFVVFFCLFRFPFFFPFSPSLPSSLSPSSPIPALPPFLLSLLSINYLIMYFT